MSNNKSSRHGVHIDEHVSYSGRVTQEFMALAKVTSVHCGCNQMDLLRMGIETIATSKGILLNGKITPEFQDAYNLELEIIRIKREKHLNDKKKGETK